MSVSFVTSLHWINSLLQGIVLSGLLLLCTELTLVCMELPENYICLNQSELSKFFMYLINHLMRYMKKITQRSPIAVTRSSNYFYLDHFSTFSIFDKKVPMLAQLAEKEWQRYLQSKFYTTIFASQCTDPKKSKT